MVGTNYCVLKQADTTFFSEIGRQATFSTGVAIAYEVGIDLSSPTGYSETGTLIHAMGLSTRPICGLNGDPAHSLGLVGIH